MQSTHGELLDTIVLVKDIKDIGRLYSKSRFGTTTKENHLKLSLIEAAFLLDENKLTIYKNKQTLSFQTLVSHAAAMDPSFETKFIVFQSLRNRGQQITICDESDICTFKQTKNDDEENRRYGIIALSERSQPDLFQLKQTIQDTTTIYDEIWIALADEEGDVTYYLASQLELRGSIRHNDYPPLKGLLLKDRALLFDGTICNMLHTQEFYGKPFGNGLQLSLVEAAYLVQNQELNIISPRTKKPLTYSDLIQEIEHYQPDILLRLRVFQDLKQRHMLVKTGFKFGTHFRVYSQTPDKNHAEYLIHSITNRYRGSWAEISRAVRLAHSVNKIFAFALSHGEQDTIFYLSLTRLRP